jgi:hypothetical protein
VQTLKGAGAPWIKYGDPGAVDGEDVASPSDSRSFGGDPASVQTAVGMLELTREPKSNVDQPPWCRVRTSTQRYCGEGAPDEPRFGLKRVVLVGDGQFVLHPDPTR